MHATLHAPRPRIAKAAGIFYQCPITIAVDTEYIIGKGLQWTSGGVYMFDTNLTSGSSNEGSLELSTHCNVGDVIGFRVVPADPYNGDEVVITGFKVSQGNVFGGSGYPTPTSDRSVWIAQAVNAGQQTYQIEIKVTSGFSKDSYYVTWDPYITAQ